MDAEGDDEIDKDGLRTNGGARGLDEKARLVIGFWDCSEQDPD